MATSPLAFSKQTLVVAGITVTVYSQPGATRPETPVVVIFLLHGRTGSARKMEEFVPGIFEGVTDAYRSRHNSAEGQPQDLCIVTFVCA